MSASPSTCSITSAMPVKRMRPARKASTAISCYPNAGLPNPLSETGFDLGPEDMARYLGDFARGGLINIAGGCCGNTPEHIAAIAKALEGKPPRKLASNGHGYAHRNGSRG